MGAFQHISPFNKKEVSITSFTEFPIRSETKLDKIFHDINGIKILFPLFNRYSLKEMFSVLSTNPDKKKTKTYEKNKCVFLKENYILNVQVLHKK